MSYTLKLLTHQREGQKVAFATTACQLQASLCWDVHVSAGMDYPVCASTKVQNKQAAPDVRLR